MSQLNRSSLVQRVLPRSTFITVLGVLSKEDPMITCQIAQGLWMRIICGLYVHEIEVRTDYNDFIYRLTVKHCIRGCFCPTYGYYPSFIVEEPPTCISFSLSLEYFAGIKKN
ncbi:hypothetical protein TSUD_367070 [Trifolium subterraneum]|uniref:Uncharacterized protein n=1 Tax=Trifolium subterraneum TaxID=3900 RepID=A0A2Z6NW78_TRISU|nr:hypothetical protein TSUD_367070 [Trifolium subterraneum]